MKNKPQKATEITFIPKPKMIELVRVTVDPEINPTVTAWCDKINIDRKTYYKWQVKPGFKEWFIAEHNKLMADMIPYLHNVGLKKALKDFRYWEALMGKFANYTPPEQILKVIKDEDIDLSALTDEELIAYRNALKKINSAKKQVKESESPI